MCFEGILISFFYTLSLCDDDDLEMPVLLENSVDGLHFLLGTLDP